jgi:uncharacterized protein (TIGR02453 family)
VASFGEVAFTGIPNEAIDFYTRLEADNSKVFWEANKFTYRDVVKPSVQALCEQFPEYGPFHLFRPYNDVRFSKNKPPYKTQQGAYAESEGGAGYYFHISSEGMLAAAGYYGMAHDQLARFRAAIDAEHTGSELAAIVRTLEKRYRFGAIDELKTAPRGYPKDHPRVELLRRKGLVMFADLGLPAWLHTPKVATELRKVWKAAAPVTSWLDTHVGPSTEQPEGFFR